MAHSSASDSRHHLTVNPPHPISKGILPQGFPFLFSHLGLMAPFIRQSKTLAQTFSCSLVLISLCYWSIIVDSVVLGDWCGYYCFCWLEVRVFGFIVWKCQVFVHFFLFLWCHFKCRLVIEMWRREIRIALSCSLVRRTLVTELKIYFLKKLFSMLKVRFDGDVLTLFFLFLINSTQKGDYWTYFFDFISCTIWLQSNCFKPLVRC